MSKLLDKDNFLPGVGDLIVTKLHFGKKDGNLTLWVQSVPRGKFSMILKDALRAYIQKNTDYKLPVFPPVPNPKETVSKSLSIGKGDYDIYVHLYSIEKYMRSNYIKAVLNHFLNGTPVSIPLSNEKPHLNAISFERAKAQAKDAEKERAAKNKLKLLQISKMMDSG